ncbi:MAG: glycine zipper domain-containing protein [Planctomycetota bacterium]
MLKSMRPTTAMGGGLVLMLTLVGGVGCQSNAQTGALIGAGLGALAGQAIGGDTGGTLIGTGVGAGLGYVVGNEIDKREASPQHTHFTQPAHTHPHTYNHHQTGIRRAY